MNKLFKIFMVIAVCAALLVMVGCNKQDDTTGGTGSNQSTGSSDASEGTGGGAEQQDTQNPEGDPHDGTLPTGQSKATEPPVGIEDPTEDTQEDDFNVDFGDLTA